MYVHSTYTIRWLWVEERKQNCVFHRKTHTIYTIYLSLNTIYQKKKYYTYIYHIYIDQWILKRFFFYRWWWWISTELFYASERLYLSPIIIWKKRIHSARHVGGISFVRPRVLEGKRRNRLEIIPLRLLDHTRTFLSPSINGNYAKKQLCKIMKNIGVVVCTATEKVTRSCVFPLNFYDWFFRSLSIYPDKIYTLFVRFISKSS